MGKKTTKNEKSMNFFAIITLLSITGCNHQSTSESLGVCQVIKKVHYLNAGVLQLMSPAGDTITVSGVLDYIYLNTKPGKSLEVKRNKVMGNYYVVNAGNGKQRNLIGQCQVIKKIGSGNEIGGRALKVTTPGNDTIFIPGVSAKVFLNTRCGDTLMVKVDRLIGGYYVPDKK